MRRFVLTALLLGAMSVSGQAADWGDLTGRFVFDGQAPEPAKINVNKDVEVFGNKNLVDESLLVGPDGGIANVVIYVRTPNVQINPDLEKNIQEKVVYDNKDGRFDPHVLTVWLGKQTVVLHNSDPVGHNANLQPLGDTGVNPLLPANSKVEHTFNRQQSIPVPVGCNIHPWMKGYILPRNNPYATVSEKDGSFKLEKLPAGELEFQVWHEKSGYVDTTKMPKGKFKHTIKAGENKLGDIKIPASVFKK
jgi:plastocyanin